LCFAVTLTFCFTFNTSIFSAAHQTDYENLTQIIEELLNSFLAYNKNFSIQYSP